MSETGQLWLVYVDKTQTTPSYDNPDWQLIGGQKDLDFKRNLGTVDVTTKDSNNNEETLATLLKRDLSLAALFQADDAGLAVLEAMHENRQKRPFKIDNGQLQYKFWAWCTDFPIKAPNEGAVDQAITIKPTGAIERTPALLQQG